MTAHRNFLGLHSQSQFRNQTPDLAEDFHVYAVKWTADTIVWFFDGLQVASMPTPSDTHKPMYIIFSISRWADIGRVARCQYDFPGDA